MEQQTRATLWEMLRELPNLALLNGRGRWHVFPRWKKQTVRVRKSNPPVSQSVCRGPPVGIPNPVQNSKARVKILLVTAIILIFGTLIFAADITITGQYLDKKNNPIAGAAVEYISNIIQLDSTSTDDNGNFTLQISTNDIAAEAIPKQFTLSQNYPNPFNPETRIPVSTPYPATLTIYNIRGQFVDKIKIPVGFHNIVWGGLDRSGRPVGAGIYMMALEGKDQRISKRLTLLDGGHSSSLHIEGNDNSHRQSSLAKTSTVDEIYFIKPNTSTKIIPLTTIKHDTSLGIVTGNPGPTIPEPALYDSCTRRVYVTWDLDSLIYNDGDSRYSLKDTAEFWIADIPHILAFQSGSLGVYSTTLYIEDVTDPALEDSMQVTCKVFSGIDMGLPWQIAYIPDQTINEDDTLKLDMLQYVFDGKWPDICAYGIDSLPNATFINDLNDVFFIPDADYYGTIDSIIIWVKDMAHSQRVYLRPFNLNIQPVNDIPRIIGQIPDQTVEEGSTLIIPMRDVYVEDVDDEHIYFNIYNLEGSDSYTHRDSLKITPYEGFEGIISGFQVFALDEHAMTEEDMVELNQFNIEVTPRVPTNLHVRFMAVYGDTLLTSGTSTFKYRKMETGTPAWDADSVRVTDNGILDIQVPRNTPLNLNGLHTNSLNILNNYVFFQKNGETIEERALDDSSAVLTFNTLNDTLTVYKLMNDFPLGDMRSIASRTGGFNVGIRKFAEYPVNAYWLTGDGHITPDSLRLARHEAIAADIRTVPHMQDFAFNTQLVENLNGIGYPRFWTGIHPDYPSPGTNATSYDEFNNVTNAQARYPWQPDDYTQAIETHQALFDLEDQAGFDPDILDRVNGIIQLNNLGRRIYSAIGIARPGTKF